MEGRRITRGYYQATVEKEKEWGRQSERWDGLHIQLKDFKLKTKRRKKLVNHGDWKKYSAELIDPKSRLKIRLNSVKKSKLGNANINLEIEADLKLFGRYSKWVKGVQLFSLSADALATVVLQVNLEIRLDASCAFQREILSLVGSIPARLESG